MPSKCLHWFRRGILALVVLAPLTGLTAEHPYNQSRVDYLPVTVDRGYEHLVLSPDGSRLYLADSYNHVLVFDTSTEALLKDIAVTQTGYIGGIAFAPDGRLLLGLDYGLVEIDPTTNQVVRELEAPWSWGGHFAFSPDGAKAYLGGGDVYVLNIANQALDFVDALPSDEWITGLYGANPSWTFYRAWQILISPDGDRLYLIGDDTDADPWYPALQIIEGLSSGQYETGLTFRLQPYSCFRESSAGREIALSADGSLLLDTCGNVFKTSDMSSIATIGFSNWSDYDNNNLVISPDGRYVFFEGFATLYGQQDRVTQSGEVVLLTDALTYELVDLDGNPSTGLGGIDLPNANGWDGDGAFNGHDLTITPDGKKLYVAAGSSGALVVNLEGGGASSSIVPDHGGNAGEVTVVVLGSYSQGSTAILRKSAAPEIASIEAEVIPGGHLQARFDLTDQSLGVYDVVIRPSSGPEKVIEKAFTIEEPRDGASVDLTGEMWVRADDQSRFQIFVENTGNNDITDLLVSLNFGEGIDYRMELPAMVPGGQTQVDQEFTTADPIQPEIIWIARMPPERVYAFWVTITATGPGSLDDAEHQIKAEAFLMGEETESLTLGIFGDICTFGEAFVTRMDKALKKNGYSVNRTDLGTAVGQSLLGAAKDTAVDKLNDLAFDALKTVAVSSGIPPLVVAATAADMVKDVYSCWKFFVKLFGLNFLFAMDPNEKVSNTGIGGYLLPNQAITYTIYFENDAEATAEARNVVVTDPLDSNLDFGSLEIIGNSHPNVFEHSLDSNSGLLTFRFTGINLPPNKTPPEGEGWVSFRIRQKANLTSGTSIRNQASIVFDTNTPIETAEVTHTVDTQPPVSQLESLPEEATCAPLMLSWSGTDQGVGVWDYSIFVSENGGEAKPWKLGTTETSAAFNGTAETTYGFTVQARDRLGHLEAAPGSSGTVTLRCLEASEEEGGCGCTQFPATEGLLAVFLAMMLWPIVRRMHRG